MWQGVLYFSFVSRCSIITCLPRDHCSSLERRDTALGYISDMGQKKGGC